MAWCCFSCGLLRLAYWLHAGRVAVRELHWCTGWILLTLRVSRSRSLVATTALPNL